MQLVRDQLEVIQLIRIQKVGVQLIMIDIQ